MNRWNIDTNFRVIYAVDARPQPVQQYRLDMSLPPYPEYTLTIVDTDNFFDKLEEKVSKSDLAEAKQIIKRIK